MLSGAPPEERRCGQRARLVDGAAGLPLIGVLAREGGPDWWVFRQARPTRPPSPRTPHTPRPRTEPNPTAMVLPRRGEGTYLASLNNPLGARLKPNVVLAKLFQCSRLSGRNKKSSKFICPPTKPTRTWWQNMLFASLGSLLVCLYVLPGALPCEKNLFSKTVLLEHHWNTAGTSYLNVAGTSNLQ